MQYTLYSLLKKHGENVSETFRKIISWVTYKTETAMSKMIKMFFRQMVKKHDFEFSWKVLTFSCDRKFANNSMRQGATAPALRIHLNVGRATGSSIPTQTR